MNIHFINEKKLKLIKANTDIKSLNMEDPVVGVVVPKTDAMFNEYEIWPIAEVEISVPQVRVSDNNLYSKIKDTLTEKAIDFLHASFPFAHNMLATSNMIFEINVSEGAVQLLLL